MNDQYSTRAMTLPPLRTHLMKLTKHFTGVDGIPLVALRLLQALFNVVNGVFAADKPLKILPDKRPKLVGLLT